MQFQREQESIIARYDFYVVDLDDDGQLIGVKKSWSNSIRGVGIRLEETEMNGGNTDG